MSPRVHVSCGFLAEQDVLALVPAIEALGIDGVTLPDHLFVPDTPPGHYPYSKDGQPPFRPESPWPDQLVLAGALGPMTTNLELTIAVRVLSLRHPITDAKAIATVSRLWGGRFSLGVGVGWQREEFEAVGIDFTRRGRLTDDAIGALRALWAPGPATFASESFSLHGAIMEPKPPDVPIHIGGASDAALRRAARLGDGFIVPSMPLADVPGQLERLRAALADASRAEAGFRVYVPCLEAPASEIAEVLDPLVTDLTFMPWPHPGKVDTTVDEKLRHLETWCADVLAPLRQLAP